MRRKKIILLLAIGIVGILTFNVYATSTQLVLNGNNKVKANSEGRLTARLETDTEKIGVVSGVVKKNDNVSSVKMIGLNGWQVTYNEATGDFNVLKAEGATKEEFAEITYTVKANRTGKVNITIENLEFTTIEYTTIKATNISKEISIETENSNTLTTIPANTQTQTTTIIPGSTVKKDTNESTNTVPTTLPKAGVSNNVIIVIIGIIVIINVVCYIKCKQHNKA